MTEPADGALLGLPPPPPPPFVRAAAQCCLSPTHPSLLCCHCRPCSCKPLSVSAASWTATSQAEQRADRSRGGRASGERPRWRAGWLSAARSCSASTGGWRWACTSPSTFLSWRVGAGPGGARAHVVGLRGAGGGEGCCGLLGSLKVQLKRTEPGALAQAATSPLTTMWTCAARCRRLGCCPVSAGSGDAGSGAVPTALFVPAAAVLRLRTSAPGPTCAQCSSAPVPLPQSRSTTTRMLRARRARQQRKGAQQGSPLPARAGWTARKP